MTMAVMITIPDNKVHVAHMRYKVDGANMGPTWGRQDPGGPHVGPINLVIWDDTSLFQW